jgi:hypothetical protein
MNFIGTWEGTCKQFTKIGNNFKHSSAVWIDCTKEGLIEEFINRVEIHTQEDGVLKATTINLKNPKHDRNEMIGMISDAGKSATFVNYASVMEWKVIDKNTIETKGFNVEFKEFQILCHSILKRIS